MTYKELKNFIETIPDNYLSNEVNIIREEQPPLLIEIGFESQDWFWDGEDMESITPEDALSAMNKEDKAELTEPLWKKGEPYILGFENYSD